jgi:peroxiredoxin
MKHYIFFILLGLFFASCDKETIKIVFPNAVQAEIEQYMQQQKYTVVIYIDSSSCTPCSLNHLTLWKKHREELAQNETGILLVIHNSDEQAVINTLQSVLVAFHFITDGGRKFKANNIEVFYAAQDNTFVMDRDRNVIFAGSPIASEASWNSFIKRIKH